MFFPSCKLPSRHGMREAKSPSRSSGNTHCACARWFSVSEWWKWNVPRCAIDMTVHSSYAVMCHVSCVSCVSIVSCVCSVLCLCVLCVLCVTVGLWICVCLSVVECLGVYGEEEGRGSRGLCVVWSQKEMMCYCSRLRN